MSAVLDNPRRRRVLGGLLAAAGTTLAPAVRALDTPSPSLPYRTVNVPGDASRVLYFFSYGCPVCREYHEIMQGWGKTLPRGVAFETVPVLVPGDNTFTMAAWAHMVARRYGREEAFAGAMYQLVHERGLNMGDAATVTAAARAAGLRGLDGEWNTAVDRERVMQNARRMVDYRIAETPSLAMGGRYVITPDHVQGDREMFVRLANGMLSSVIRGTAGGGR